MGRNDLMNIRDLLFICHLSFVIGHLGLGAIIRQIDLNLVSKNLAPESDCLKFPLYID